MSNHLSVEAILRFVMAVLVVGLLTAAGALAVVSRKTTVRLYAERTLLTFTIQFGLLTVFGFNAVSGLICFVVWIIMDIYWKHESPHPQVNSTVAMLMVLVLCGATWFFLGPTLCGRLEPAMFCALVLVFCAKLRRRDFQMPPSSGQ